MTADQYLRGLLQTYAVNASEAMAAGRMIYPVLKKWGNQYLNSATFSGSLAKGTGISISTDADIFLSLSSVTPGTLSDIYSSLHQYVAAAGYTTRKQNVSIGVSVNGCSIDLVPGRRQSQYGNDHSLYRSRAGTWTKTNVNTHISYVKNSKRTEEIRILKLWRLRHELLMSSFYLELAVIDSLHYARVGNVADNVLRVLEHLRDNIESVRYIDPANSNNIVSDDYTRAEKAAIATQAGKSLREKTWQEIVW
ncbi:nucleotidyltransferase [Chromobacterium sp. Panama]|uniref:nucleotidyltransferase n=1 Tax=Chromobacterium sp. Panama TaxID=2161826 RepID=UPI000D325497|nr:nucleotidyltransferase [Chromobacterium sp. Panama]PTU65152.1 nucleotidyltransferase [Chromobacterium sp. Panama]